MARPNLKDYYYAAQLGSVIKWCDKDNSAKWKEIEMKVSGIPIQSLIGNVETFKALQDSIDPISLNTWFDLIKHYKLEREVNILSWFAYDNRFKPNLGDQNFKRWETKGITAMCTVTKNGNMMSFVELKEKYGLENSDFFRYLQLGPAEYEFDTLYYIAPM